MSIVILIVISPFSFVPPLRAVRQQEGHPAHRDLAVQKRPLQDDHRRQVSGGRRRPRLHPQRGQGGKNKGYQFGTNFIEYIIFLIYLDEKCLQGGPSRLGPGLGPGTKI